MIQSQIRNGTAGRALMVPWPFFLSLPERFRGLVSQRSRPVCLSRAEAAALLKAELATIPPLARGRRAPALRSKLSHREAPGE
jgi:hypothetical protein